MLLKDIHSPADLKRLTQGELNTLAFEIREEIMAVVTENGGHLASNLGVVELTIALHLCYDSPTDKLLFDVGHQSYVHKLLTGRYERFATLRKEGGISGFTLRSESPHDPFGAGHSGTAVSAALGFARARQCRGEIYDICAVVGDGSFMNGPSMEAINDLGHAKLPMVVVLNDNEMSIAKNVGGLSRYLGKLRTRPGYQRLKRSTKLALDRLPLIGGVLSSILLAVKKLMRFLFVNGEFFSSLGLDYLGPVDGHSLEELISAINAAKSMERPVLLHVVTQKGKGYEPAEAKPDSYHGVSPANAPKSAAFAYAKTAGETLVSIGEKDPQVVAVTAAMPSGSGADIFARAFPDRCFDVGIAESHGVTTAAAMAAGGLKPYFMVYSTFLQRGYDQILHDVALQGLNVGFLLTHAGLVGEDGYTHNGVFDLSYLLQVPGMTVLSPSCHEELSLLMRWASQCVQGPFAIRYAKAGNPATAPVQPLEEGAWPLLKQGNKATILAVGEMVWVALQAAELLAQAGLEVAVVNARVLMPLPKDALQPHLAAPLITLEENVPQGGFGSLVARQLEGRQTVLQIGVEQGFVQQATRARQLEICGLDAKSVAAKIAAYLEGK